MASNDEDLLQGIFDAPLQPDTNLPDNGNQADVTAFQDEGLDITNLFTPTQRTRQPIVGAGPIDTTLNPADFKRINQLRPGDDHFERRARAQTWWDLIKGSSVQSLAVAAGATVESAGSLADLLNPNFYTTVAKGQQDFESNFVTRFGRQIQESARENFPVYTTRRTQEGFAPGDATWYASLTPSIFTSVGFLIPAGGVGLAVGRAARALQLTRGAQGGARLISAGLASRHMESQMESAQLWEEKYQQALAQGAEDAAARELAGNAAAFRYVSDYMNLGKDLLAWGIAFKGINYANRALQGRAANFAQHAPRNSHVSRMLRSEGREMPPWLKGSRDLLKVGAAESLEEVNQGYMSLVADRWADEISGMAPSERPNGISYYMNALTDGSVGEHLKDRHTWDEAIMGFMGGMIFGGLSKPAMNLMGSSERTAHERDIRNIETQLQGVNHAMDAYTSAVQEGDTARAEMVLTSMLGKVNMDAVKNGTLDINRDIYNSILQANEEQLEGMGLGQGAKESAQTATEHADRIEKSFNTYMNMELGEATPHIALQAAWLETDGFFNEQIANKHEMNFNSELEQSGMYQSLSSQGQERMRLRNEEHALLHVIESNEQAMDEFSNKADLSVAERLRLDALKETTEAFKTELTEVRDRRTDADNRSSSELSSQAHERESSVINTPAKSKGFLRELFRAYDAKSAAQMRRGELARLLDADNIAEISETLAEQRRAEERQAEQATKEQDEEVTRSEAKEETKQEKRQTERSAFIDKNSVALEDLGFPFETLDQYSMADLQMAMDEKIGPQELARIQEQRASDREADPGAGMPTVSEESADFLARKFGLKKKGQSTQQPEPPPPDDAPTPPGPPEPTPDTPPGPAPAETDPPAEASDVHPEDIDPLTPEQFEEGEWFTELMMPPGDIELLPIDGYIYMINPSDGMIYDSKTREVAEGTALYNYLLEEMQRTSPELAGRVQRGGMADIDGTLVDLKLADGTRKLIVDENGGVFDARSGIAVPNERVRNMALVKAENNPGRWYRDDNVKVAVLEDNRIISTSKSNAGTEIYKPDSSPQEQGMRQKILDAIAETPNEIEEAMQETADQSAQTGQEPETADDSELLEDFPEVEVDFDQVRPESKLYWKSTRNIYGQEGGNEAATTFFEDSEAQVVGAPVEFIPSTDEVALQRVPDEIAEAYKKGTPIDRQGNEFYIDTAKGRRKIQDDQFPAIAAYVLNEQGERMEAAGEQIRAFLPQPFTVRKGRKLTDQQKSEAIRKVLANRAEMYNAYHAGNTMRSTIASRGSGFPITERTKDGGPQRNNVAEYIQSLDEQGVDYRFGLINRDSIPLDQQGPFMMEVEGQPGNFILFIEGFEGIYYPHKLNVRAINREEANFAAALIKGYLNGDIGLNDMITPDISEKVNGITVQEFFDLLVFHGRDATNIYTKRPNDYRRGRTMYFSTAGGRRSVYLGDRRYTSENIEGEVETIALHLTAHKNHQISKEGFGRGDSMSALVPRNTPITWFNRKINPSEPGSYRKFLFEGADPAVTTDATINTPPLTQPSIHFNPELLTAEQGETLFETEKKTIIHKKSRDSEVNKGKQGYKRIRRKVGEDGFSYVYGKKVNIEALPEATFYIITEITGQWRVLEETTGQPVSHPAQTQVRAIESANETIRMQTPEKVRKMLKDNMLFPEELENLEKNIDQQADTLDDKYDEHLKGIDPIDPVRFSASRPDKVDLDYDIEAELEAVRKLLPPGVEINIDPNINIFAKLAGHENPSQVYGMFYRGMIQMAQNAPEGTAYHEAFHAVFNLSLLEESRRKIYTEAEPLFRERYGREHENDLELEEFLADEFAAYMGRDGNHTVGEVTDGFFRRIWNWIKNLFTSQSATDRVFENISSGFYAQAPRYSSEFAATLSAKFKEESDIFTPVIKDSMIRSLAYQVAHRANFQASEDVTNIDLSAIPSLVAGYYTRYKNSGDVKKANIWGQALLPGNRQKLVEGVEDFFASLGIQGKNHKAFDADMHARQEYDDVDYDQRDTKERLFIPTAYEYSNWDSSGANTKLMVSLLPRLESYKKNSKGEYQYQYNEITGDPMFVEGERVWNMLMDGLSDIVTTSEASSWSQILTRIRELARREPALHVLADRLESKDMPQHKKSEFYNAVGSKVAMNFKTMIAGPNDRRRSPEADASEPSPFDVAIFNSDLYREGRKTVKQWQSGFRGKFFSVQTNQLIINRNDLSHAINGYKKARNALMTGVTQQSIEGLASALNRTGIEMDVDTLHSFFAGQDSVEGARKYLLSQLDTIFLDTKAKSFANMVHHKNPEAALVSDNPFTLRPMRMLAQMHNKAHTELSENTILAAEAKSKWIYSEANYYFDTLNRLKTDPKYLASAKKERMQNHLTILDALEKGKDLRYTVIANVKSRRKFDEGRDFADSTPYEEFVLKYNSTLRGIAPALNFSDKKTAMFLEGLDFDPMAVLTRHDPAGEGPVHTHELTEEIIDQFTGYMISELQRVYQVQEDLKVLPDDALIENYHYGLDSEGNIDRTLARGLQFVLFPQLSKAALEESNPTLHEQLYGQTSLVSEYTPKMRQLLNREAEKFIRGSLRQEYEKLRRHRLLTAEGEFARPVIDAGYMSREYGKNVDSQMRAALSEFSRQHSSVSTATVHGLAMMVEQDLLIHGDPAFFKDFDDLRKRTSGPAAFRRRLNTSDPGVRPFYRMAVARDVIKPSEYLDELRNELKKIDGMTPARIKKILSNYEAVNTTDAQAYITLDRAVEILKGEGRWRPSDDQILERWKAGETDVLSSRGGRRIMQLFLTPFKGVHYGIERTNPDSNLRSPVYLKYSQMVLLPGMIQRSAELQSLDTAMRGGDPAGEYVVDELVFESGVKVGRRAKRDVSNFSNLQLVPNILSNENWGRQVETPTKGITESGLDGTQLRRNILLGLRDGRTYGTDQRSAKQVEYEYNRVISEMVRRGLTGFEQEVGAQYLPKTGLGRIGNIERFGAMMRKEAKARNSAKNVMDSYQTKDHQLRVELEINPHGNRSEALFLSLIKQRAVRQDVFGGSYVQASSYGFDSYNQFAEDQMPSYPPVMSYAELSEEQIEKINLLDRVENLKPPLLKDGKVQRAQVLIPSHFGQPVAKAAGKPLSHLTRDEVQAFFADSPELLQFIGYRIPNQPMGAIDSLEVVGFLPEDMGDTMVVYEGLTAKNDSDFDVDKMFALMPEFKIVNGKPVLYEFYDNTNSKKQLGAIYNDRYERQGQLRSLVDKLDRVRELSSEEGLQLSEIQSRETNVDFENGSWLVGGKTETEIEFHRERLAEIPTRAEFIEENMGADPFLLNSDQALHNFRLQVMGDIMDNPLTMADSLMPITDTELVGFARELAGEVGSRQVYTGAMEFLPSSQIEIGRRFRSGKNMVGILANHIGSHAISTKTNLQVMKSEVAAAFAKTSRVEGKTLKSSLSEYEDKKGRPIVEQLSTLLSGFLDATSDSWALELNLTDDTANTAALILRLGAGWEGMLRFLNQPAIRELVELKPLVAEGLVRARGRSAEAHLIRHYTDLILADLDVSDLGEALNQRKIEERDLRELLSDNQLRINLKPVKNSQYYFDQIQTIQAFQELQEVATSVGNFISTTKFDVDMPASVAKLMINELRMEEASDSGILDIEGYIDNSLLQPFQQVYKTANAIAAGTYLGRSMLGRETTTLLFGNKFKPAFTGADAYRGKRNENTLRDIQNAMVTYALQSQAAGQQHTNPVYRESEQIKAMFYGNRTMARRLIEVKEILGDDNALVNYMHPSIEPGRPDFIEISYREKGVLFKDRLSHGWSQLLSHPNEAVREFAQDLTPYAYTTSGMRRGMNTIQDLMPVEVLEEVSNYFREWKKVHANNRDALGYAEQIAREVLRNEYNNELLVPTVYRQHLMRKHFREKLLAGFDVHRDNLPVGQHTDPEGNKVDVPPQVIQHGEQLYKLVGHISTENRYVYGLLQKKGYHDGEFHIYEYFNPDGPSLVESNEVPWSVPFDDTFYQSYAPVADFFPVVDPAGNREFRMDKILENKIC